MWSRKNNDALRDIVQRCRQLVVESTDAESSSMDVSQMVGVLDRSLEELKKPRQIELSELKVLLAVAGPLQETAMGNGWVEEYLMLGDRFDAIIGKEE